MAMLTMAAGLVGAVGVGYLGLKVFCPWIFKDIHYLKTVLPLITKLKKLCHEKYFIPDAFEDRAREQPDKIFVFFEGKTYTYKFMNEEANRVARAAMKIGIKRGDTVAMVIYNEPAFIWTYLGFLKLGVKMALINFNQRSKTLLHSLIVADAKYILIGEGMELVEAVAELIDDLPTTKVYVQGCPKDKLPKEFKSFHDVMEEMSCDNIDKNVRKDIMYYDPAVYIYTSGTTGLPKAATLSQRGLLKGFMVSESVKFNTDDVFMISLPLYHSSALIIGVTSVIISGASMVLCRKFSASKFWDICRKYKATIFLYIGELCRYLMAVPPNNLDQKHDIRVAVGNGLRRDIFQEFQQRFAIPWIGEFYASTEGPLGFINCLNVPGSCGRYSPFLGKFVFLEFVKYDFEKEEPVRNKHGFCVPAERLEPGLLLSQINEKQPYDGYKGRKELSESKIIRNVVKEGDKYFNTGDLFTLDDEYNLYFNDRIGDTFRWKGENVSTTEVSNILTDLDFITDACVYGVKIPDQDGKAGMAALALREDLQTLDENQLSQLSAHCSENFPDYERPIFLRIPKGLTMTSTIKQNKVVYKEESFDKTQITDDMYVYDKEVRKYRPLTDEVYKEIMDKNYKF